MTAEPSLTERMDSGLRRYWPRARCPRATREWFEDRLDQPPT
ncbi:MAG TPA: hypothetical protein VFC19_48845 [Candidatus Limnocylindrales bacterium]|nr:hypothetical protein [Candidatus Limnocylindrales bacterium]